MRTAAAYALTGLAVWACLDRAPGAEPVPRDEERILQRLWVRAKWAGTTGSPRDIEQVLDAVRRKWGDFRDDEYYRVVLELCVALNSSRPTDPDRVQRARSIAADAADSTGAKSFDCQVRLLLLLQSDPDYSDGSLRGGAWAKERPVRVARWLKVWNNLIDTKLEPFDENDPPALRVYPPAGAGIPPGAPPELVRDPVLRKQYETTLALNAEKVRVRDLKYDYLRAKQLFESTATTYVVEAYSKPPYDTPELDRLLASSRLDANKRSAILARVTDRIAARPDSPLRSPPPEARPSPSPVSATWRTDGRLQAGVTLDLRSPTVDDVIREIGKATGVELSRAEDIRPAAPALGSLSTRGVPAWQVMEQLAASKRVEGTWQTAGTGYRLVRNAPRVQALEPGAEPAAAAPDMGRWSFFPAVVGGSLLLLLVAGGAYWRVRGRRHASRPTPPPAGSTGLG